MIQQPERPTAIGPCRVCGWEALTEGGLCVDCRDAREWSRVNRAFCRLVHRARYVEEPAARDSAAVPAA